MVRYPHSLLILFAAGASLVEVACGGGTSATPNTQADAKAKVDAPTAPEPLAAAPTPALAPAPVAERSSDPIEVRVRFREETADGAHRTEFQSSRLVGHYSTPNGKIGFILDRTSDPPRIRLDGDAYVLVLTPRQASRGWLEFVASNIWLRIDEESGRILSFSAPGMKDASYVIRDADAKPLAMTH
jgi:hypothetical protein